MRTLFELIHCYYSIATTRYLIYRLEKAHALLESLR